ncbi:MAG: GYF domain-containing protein [Myxococcota bacterium]
MIVVRPPAAEEPAPAATESNEPAEEEQQAPAGQMGGAFDAMFGDSQGQSGFPEDNGATDSASDDAGQSAANDGFTDHDAGNGAVPGAAGFDSDGAAAGAFGFEGESSSGGETDFALGSLEREPTGAGLPDSTRPAGEKEWYVAIDDSQVGPIDLAEVEQRWDGRELDEDSLAWKAGMADWLPIADVAELSYLITERPQTRPSVGAGFGNTAATLGGGAGAGASVAAASFDAAEGPAIEWKPSAASALSSLVEEEIVAPSTPEPAAPAANAQPPLEGMPSFGANDVFGGGNGANGADTPSPAAAGGFGAPAPVAAPIGGDVGGGWSVPETRSSGGGNGMVIALFALVLLLVLGLGGGAYYFLVVKGGEDPVKPTPSGPVIAEKTPEAKPAEPAEPKPEEKPTVVAQNDPKPEETATAPKVKTPKDKPKGRDRPKTKPKTRPKNDPLDPDNIEKKAAAKSLADLTKDDIVAGVKKNGGKLKPCLTAARSKGEILPGKYRFILNWRIQPSGGTSDAKLTGPGEVMGTSLPQCFRRVMSSWRFKPSKAGAPIKNFPLPITVR